jgi:SAM-dependent methyltransferase
VAALANASELLVSSTVRDLTAGSGTVFDDAGERELKGEVRMKKDDPAYKGQSGYNPALLAIYDVWVLKFMAPAVWKCPIAVGVTRYRQHMGPRHLDVGPGTGYFIEQAAPSVGTEITLLDPNPHVLEHASKRLAAWSPRTVEADVMKPLPVEGGYDSAALSFVLHCLREPMSNKAIAIRNIADVLTPDGVLFGGTVLGTREPHTRSARAFLWAFNKQGGFDNRDDTTDGLHEILDASFRHVEIERFGSTALFSATVPRSS